MYLDLSAWRALISAIGLATLIDPVPMTLIALRFLEPQTEAKRPWPAPLPASWTSAPWQRFSPAGPIATIAGFCVVRPQSRASPLGVFLNVLTGGLPVFGF